MFAVLDPKMLQPPVDRVATVMRAVGMSLEGGEVVRIIAPPPAVEALPTDAEVAARERGVATLREVVSHPLEPELAGTA